MSIGAIQYTAFSDELLKVATSPDWVRKRVGAALWNKPSEARVGKFIDKMNAMSRRAGTALRKDPSSEHAYRMREKATTAFYQTMLRNSVR